MNKIKDFIEGMPIPAAGVALGLAALGNLLSAYSGELRIVLGSCSAILAVLVFAKMVVFTERFRADLKNPVVATTCATFFMTCMQLATYAAPFAYGPSFVLWCAAIVCHFGLMAWFTLTYMRKFQLTDVHATYFICYVGIVVGALTSPTFGMESLGKILFWFGFVCYAALLVLVTVRYAKHEVAEAAKPTFCVYTAPMSLSLAGYLAVTDSPNLTFVAVLAVLAQLLLAVVLTQVPKFLRLKFYPSYAAMTFPFVITATAYGSALAVLREGGFELGFGFDVLAIAEVAVATFMVLYVFARYIGHFVSKLSSTKEPEAVVVPATTR